MQYITFNATAIVTPETAQPPDLETTFQCLAQTNPANILHFRFYLDTDTDDGRFEVIFDELPEECSALDQKLTGWKLAIAWSVVFILSWELLIGCVVIARALLP